MPHKSWAIGEEVLAADFNPNVADQVVATFASAAARAAAWPAPPIGAVSHLTSLPGVLWVFAGSAWRLAAPRGVLNQAQWTTASGTTAGAAIDVAGASVAFAMVTGHLYRYTVTGHYVSSALGDVLRLTVCDPANAAKGGATDVVVASANIAHGFTLNLFETGTADATATRKLRIARNAGTGNAQVFADATRPGTITVEEVHVGTSGG